MPADQPQPKKERLSPEDFHYPAPHDEAPQDETPLAALVTVFGKLPILQRAVIGWLIVLGVVWLLMAVFATPLTPRELVSSFLSAF